MPRRTASHELEEKSRTAFRAACPTRWTVEDIQHDYGVDLRVALFNASDGSATGLEFYVQLKATAAAEDKGKLRLRRDHLEYWSRLQLPVLICCYHAPSQSFRALWSWAIHLWPDERKTLTLTLTDIRPWTTSIPSEQVEDEVRLYNHAITRQLNSPLVMHYACPLQVDGLADPNAVVAKVNRLLDQHDLSMLMRPVPNKPLSHIFLEILPGSVLVAIGPRFVLCESTYIDFSNASNTARDLGILVASLAYLVGQGASASQVLAAHAADSHVADDPNLFGWIAGILFEAKHHAALLALIDRRGRLDEDGPARTTAYHLLTRLARIERELDPDTRAELHRLHVLTAPNPVARAELTWKASGISAAQAVFDAAASGADDTLRRVLLIAESRLLLLEERSAEALLKLEDARQLGDDDERRSLTCQTLAITGCYRDAANLRPPEAIVPWEGPVLYGCWWATSVLSFLLSELLNVPQQRRGSCPSPPCDWRSSASARRAAELGLDLWNEDTWLPILEQSLAGDRQQAALASLAVAVIRRKHLESWSFTMALHIDADWAIDMISLAVSEIFSADVLADLNQQVQEILGPAADDRQVAERLHRITQFMHSAPSRHSLVLRTISTDGPVKYDRADV